MRKKVFHTNCRFRYDEIRPDRGTYAKDKTKSGGLGALSDRCLLRNYGNRKCLYIGGLMSAQLAHKDCPIGKGR